MPLAELPRHDARAHPRGQLEEAKRVRDRRAVFAEPRRERFLRVASVLDEAIEPLRELHRAEIFPLKVLDERELERVVLRHGSSR